MQAVPIAHQAAQPVAGPFLAGYPAAVLCWLLSAGVYIAAK
ncbi:EamA family transporter, partial [Mesorhizobium sp. M7A.F.Ca.MR.148.00.0.0]